MKTYSSKAAARKGAKRQGLDFTKLSFYADRDGKWYWINKVNTIPSETVEIELTDTTNVANEVAVVSKELVAKAKIKIEKERPELNGVVRPSENTKCRDVWDACDAFHQSTKRSPTCKEIKELAVDKCWNKNNAVIEMYQWRKFNGIGRE